MKENFQSQNAVNKKVLPRFSIVLPVKNEHKVIGRLFDSISNLRYPSDRLEIVIVEDGSNDGTSEICRRFVASHANAKLLQRLVSNGKPSALNYAIEHCSGEIIAFFDADAIPDSDILSKAAAHFVEPSVGALQGRTPSVNADENMLAKLIAFEQNTWFETYLQGKQALDLFVPLRGSCQFIRSSILKQVGGFDETFLCEDTEISARITCKGYRIKYCSDLRAWQENPSSFRIFLKQRIRWSKGNLQVALKYTRLLSRVTPKRVDAEISILSPIIGSISTASFALVLLMTNLLNYPFSTVVTMVLGLSATATGVIMSLCALALVSFSKQKQAKSLLLLPLFYGFLNFQIFLNLYAIALLPFRRPKVWTKTEKSGVIANADFLSEV